MKKFALSFLILLSVEGVGASPVTVNYHGCEHCNYEAAFGTFQFDSMEVPAAYHPLGEAVYFPKSSFLSFVYPEAKFSYTGQIDYIIVGNDVVNSAPVEPYDYFEIGVRETPGGGIRIFLFDFSGSQFTTDNLPTSLFLKDFDYSRLIIDGTFVRYWPLASLATVPLPLPFFLLASALGFGVTIQSSLIFKRGKRDAVTSGAL